MKYQKPAIDRDAAAHLLQDKLQLPFTNLSEATSGQIARTYNVDIARKPYILQFNQQNMAQSSRNEQRFREQFRQLDIPIRNVLYEGDFAGYRYTLAEKLEGTGLDKLPMPEFMAVMPAVMDLLLRIASVDTSATTGFGWFDAEGNGHFASWREHLCFVREEEPGWFYDHWHTLFETTFLERDIFDHYFHQMEALIDLCPSHRELCHGGFGYGNVLVHEGRISAVLDWQDSRYGDHVFDLAYLLHWFDVETQQVIVGIYQEALARAGRTETHLAERIQCYRYFTGIDGLRYAAKTDNENFYQAVLGKLTKIDNR